ncbi:DUF3575 domain-containing protein [Dysgonomonas sp. 216]|nr:DUF3575 domain-containing protein [Dysgonomonas sp. 216]
MFWCGIIYAAGALNASTAVSGSELVDVSTYANEETKQVRDSSFSKTVRIHYRVNKTVIDRNYLENAKALNIIDEVFKDNPIEDGDFIVITGRASPEGPFRNNQRLAEARALSLKNYIKQKYPEIKGNQIVTLSGDEDWDGLIMMIEKNENVPYRHELLSILNSGLKREKQKAWIKKLNNGKVYSYLLKNILPYLRESVTGTIYFKKGERFALGLVRTDTVEVHRVDTVFVEKEILRTDTICPPKVKRSFVMAIKNNLIYDAALLPNLAIEIPFGHNYNWSVGIEGNWSWWNTNANSYYYHRIQIAGVELRRWFGNRTGNPLNGWFVGAYGYGGTYDIRLFTEKNSDEGQLSNWSYSGGLTFGYAMPIAKRFNLEFGLGVGYLGGRYHKYTVGACEECIFPWQSTHQRSYIGLTKANISLVWLIGNIFNKNKGKEDQR